MGRPALAVREPHDRAGVLQVALRVFKERGYDGASMADIAAALGISKSSLYHHIEGKEQLLDEAVSGALDALFAVLEEPRATAGAASARLEHVIRRTVGITVTQLDAVSVLLRVRGNTAVERRVVGRRREFDRRVEALVAAAVRDREVRNDLDGALVTRLVFGMTNSVVEWFRPGRGISEVVLADAIVALCFHGLRTSP